MKYVPFKSSTGLLSCPSSAMISKQRSSRQLRSIPLWRGEAVESWILVKTTYIFRAMPYDGWVSCLECSGGKREETELFLGTEDSNNAGRCINELLTVRSQRFCCWWLWWHSPWFFFWYPYCPYCFGFCLVGVFVLFWQDSFLKRETGPYIGFSRKQNYHILCFNETSFIWKT